MKKRENFLIGLILAFVWALFPIFGFAADPKTMEGEWTVDWYSANSSAASSTHTPAGYAGPVASGTVLGVEWLVYAKGADAQFTVHHTTKGQPGRSQVWKSSSSLITVPAGKSLSDSFQAISPDPSLVVHGLDTSATVYVTIKVFRRMEK